MSAGQTADIYQPGDQAIDPDDAAHVFIDNLSQVLSRTEAEAAFATRAKGRPMILDNPQKESKTRAIQKSKVARQKEDKRRRKLNLQNGKERLTPKSAVKGLK